MIRCCSAVVFLWVFCVAGVHESAGQLAETSWPMMGRDAAHTGFYPGTLGGRLFVAAWSAQLGLSKLNQATTGEGKVFAAPTGSGGVHALDLVTGTRIWNRVWDWGWTGAPAYHDGAVYMYQTESISKFWSFDAADGSTRWSISFLAPSINTPPPVVTDTAVYVSANNSDRLCGLDRNTGTQLFVNSSLGTSTIWTPTVHDGKVYSFATGKFRQHHATTGTIEWMLDLGWTSGGPNEGSAVIDSGSAFVVNMCPGDDELVCIDLSSRTVRWRVQMGFTGTPAVVGSRVYAFERLGSVKALDVTTGELLRTYDTGIGWDRLYQPIIMQDVLIASSATGTAIHALETGTKLQHLPVGGIPSLSGDRLILAGTDGILRGYLAMADNTAPAAQNLSVTAIEDQALTLTLPGTDADGQALGGIITALPAKGTLYQTADGVQTGDAITHVPALVSNPQRQVIYKAPPDDSGMGYTTFKFKVHDGIIPSVEATASLDVTRVNDIPVAVDDIAYLRPGSVLEAFQPLRNDLEADGETLTLVSFTQPAQGSVTQNADGSLRYVPQASFTEGTDTFQYTVQDTTANTATGTIQIQVSAAHGYAWTQTGNDANHSGRYPGSLGAQPWLPRWEYSFSGLITPVVVEGDQAYINTTHALQSSKSTVALDRFTGTEIWRTALTSGQVSPPSLHQDTLYMQCSNGVTDAQLLALNKGDGSLRWSTPYLKHAMENTTMPSPAVTSSGVYLSGGVQGGLYGFNPDTGAHKFLTGLPFYSGWTPAILDGKVYSFVGSSLRQHHPDTGAEDWVMTLGAPSGSGRMNRQACLDDGKAYLVNVSPGGSELICVDLSLKTVLWRTSGLFFGTPAVINGLVYACLGSTVKAYHTRTGALVAEYQAGTDPNLNGNPVVSNDLLIIGSNTKTYVFNLASRALIQTLNFGAQVAVADDLLYLSCLEDATVRVYGHLIPGNEIPVAQSAQISLLEDTQTVVMLQATDGNGDALKYVIRSLPAQGSLFQTSDGITPGQPITQVPALVKHPGGTVLYQPPLDGYGANIGAFTFSVHDRHSTSSFATVSFQITPVNDPPQTFPDHLALRRGASLLHFRPEVNDRDADPDPLTVIRFTQGEFGTVEQNADGSLNYHPDHTRVFSTDTFTYTIRDIAGHEVTGSVTLTMSSSLARYWPTFGAGPDHTGHQPISLGTAPFIQRWQTPLPAASRQLAIARGRVFATSENVLHAVDARTGNLLWKRTFLEYSSLQPPTWYNNNLYIQNTDTGNWTDRLYSLNDTTGGIRWSALFSDYGNDYMAPSADESGVFISGGYYNGIYGFSHSGTQFFYQNLPREDEWTPTLHQGGLYSYVDGSLKSHNKTTGAAEWSLELTTAWGYNHRTIACMDGRAFLVKEADTAPTRPTPQELMSVNLTTRAVAWRVVGPFIGTPAAAHQAIYAIAEGKTVMAHDSLTGRYLGTYAAPADGTGLVSQPIVTADSLIIASARKTYFFDLGSRTLLQTLPHGGLISLAGETLYIASDDGVIRAFDQNRSNLLPIALPLSATTNEETAVSVSLQGLDAEEAPLTFLITALPEHGTLYQTANGVTPGSVIDTVPTPVTHAGSKVIYRPAADRFGSPLSTFQFAAHDGQSASLPVTATLNVLPAPDAPTAQNDTRQAEPGQVLSPLREQNNDFDPDGDPIPLVTFTQPAHGRVIQNGDGTLRYQAPAHLATGTDSFTYTLRDSTARTGTATVTVIIGPFMPPPSPDDPVITPPGGTFDQPVQVTLGTAVPGMTIHYTLDGRAPNPDSPSFAAGTTVTLHQSALLRIISMKGSEISSIRQAAFAFTDSDGDGLTDSWENYHFGSLDLAAETTDLDLDGMSDSDELFAGTDPRSAADRFAATVSTGPDGTVTLAWASKPGFSYVVETSTDLVLWRSENTSASIAGDGSSKVHPLSSGSRRRAFVRVRVQPDLTGP